MTAAKLIIKNARLRYVSDEDPGYSRQKTRGGFNYSDVRGARIRKALILKRIERLVIPPAWTDVWICPSLSGHIQATGRDEKGRKQYIYHPRWREESNLTKFMRMVEFGHALPRIRKEYSRAMKSNDLTREKVLATLTALLERTHIRIGNETYAEENNSFGLTTLQKKHVDIRGCKIRFRFPGKSKKMWNLELNHPRLCKAVRKCQDLPGQQLFKYKNDKGRFQAVSSQDVNAYLKGISGEDFTAKDFRTWHATVAAFKKLRSLAPPENKTEGKRVLSSVVKEIARQLNNTAAVCRRYYIHPSVLEAYERALLSGELSVPSKISRLRGLGAEEKETLAFLAASSVQKT